MDVIEKYGADALRWFLSNGSAPGQDVRFSYEKMDASWNFINKIWNISRYILMNNEGLTLEQATANVEKVVNKEAGNVTDRWILHNLNETIGKVTENFDKFEKEAGRALEEGLVHPAYDYVLKCSHTFNLLDARGAVSVTERAGYIARIRNLARVVAKPFVADRKKLGYPLLDEATRAKLLAEEEE